MLSGAEGLTQLRSEEIYQSQKFNSKYRGNPVIMEAVRNSYKAIHAWDGFGRSFFRRENFLCGKMLLSVSLE
jgi:hypothetical protein